MEQLALAYLMLVTFATPHIRGLEESHFQCLDASPYLGCAAGVIGAYDAHAVPALEEFSDAIELARQHPHKHIWPWVFLNRMIGRDADARAHGGAPPSPYFAAINAMDLDDAAGARSDYLALWRLSLKLTRQLRCPGVVLDLEAYNDYRTNRVAFVAQARGESPDRVIEQLRDIGARMADIAAQECPNVIIWSLFTNLHTTQRHEESGREFHPTVAYIVLGLLDRAAERDLPLRLVDGGETTVGYYSKSLQHLTDKIEQRSCQYEPFLSRFGGRLALGGTIAPWWDGSEIKSWLRSTAGDDPPYRTLRDFAPLIQALLKNYDYVWIYGASAANYQPYDPDIAAEWNPVLDEIYAPFRDTHGGSAVE